jgi:hypothetical protein
MPGRRQRAGLTVPPAAVEGGTAAAKTQDLGRFFLLGDLM